MKTGKATSLFTNGIAALIICAAIANPMPELRAEQNREEAAVIEKMRKDFTKVLREKKKPAEKHREFILKWQKQGRLSTLLTLYETEKENAQRQQSASPAMNAAFYYGLGYVHALEATKTDETFDTAVTHLQHALEIEPDLFWAHFNLGGIYQQQNESELALAEFETCVRLNPNYYPVYYRIGDIHLKQQNYIEALQAFETARKLNRKWEYPQYGIGLVYLAQGETDRAREAFENITHQKKKFVPAYIKLGQVLATQGFFDDALTEYAKAAQHQPYAAQDLYELAVIFNEKGNTDGAIQLYQRTIETEPMHAQSHFALGEIFYTSSNTETALHHYQQALSVMPSLKDTFYEPLEPYFAGLMTPDQAMPIIEKAMFVLPNAPRSSFYAGMIETDAGNIEKAIQHYEKTIEIVEADASYLQVELPLGSFLDAYFKLGELHHQQGDIDTAVNYFKRALELNPALADRFIVQGQRAFDEENYQDAIEPLNIHLLLFPEDVSATYLLGQSYEASSDADNAITFYERTLTLDPQRPDVLFKMVHIYRGREAHQQAVDTLKRLIEIAPETTEAHYLLALSYLSLKQPNDALPAFLETIRLRPDDVAAHYHAAILFEENGEIDNAIVHYEKTITLDTTLIENDIGRSLQTPMQGVKATEVEPFFRLGAIYRQRNDEDNILRIYQPALEIEPEHPEIHHLLAVIFEKRDERENAIRYYGLANHYNPDNFDWHYSYARLLDRHAETLGEDYHKHAEMAVNEYTTTIALNPDYVDAYFYRGMLTLRYRQIGKTLYRYSQILEDFKQVALFQPKNREANYNIGVIYLEIDRHRPAREAFERMLSYAPKYRGIHLHLGKIAEWEQAWKAAIKHYEAEAALIQQPAEKGDDIAAKTYQRLGELYYAHALDYNAAKETLEKALALDDTHVPTLLNYANNFFSMDLLGSAAEQFERVIQLEPDNLTANYNLALMYEYTEKSKQAKAQWKRFLELNPPEQWKIEAEKHLRQ
ncbi:MAG: tetratricopeptide repeat protein [Candidatus Poribacteria bacterium]|nr:tetratricopeptide repeat protein [Candidatus Poribacteria bacterium]